MGQIFWKKTWPKNGTSYASSGSQIFWKETCRKNSASDARDVSGAKQILLMKTDLPETEGVDYVPDWLQESPNAFSG